MSPVLAPPPDTATLAAAYRRAKARHSAAPAVATVRRRLAGAQAAFSHAAEALGAMSPAELELMGSDRSSADQLLAALDNITAQAAAAMTTLDRRGGRVGGNRRITSLLHEPSARHQLLAALTEAMPTASKAQLLAAMDDVLVAAGHSTDSAGAEHVLRQVLKARRSAVTHGA